MSLSRRNFVFATATLLAVPAPVFAKNIPELNLSRSGLALRGVDPTSYFTEGKPVKGSRNITPTHTGGTYRFVSEASQALFESDPEAYLPAYGGYCSYGTAVKAKVMGTPTFGISLMENCTSTSPARLIGCGSGTFLGTSLTRTKIGHGLKASRRHPV